MDRRNPHWVNGTKVGSVGCLHPSLRLSRRYRRVVSSVFKLLMGVVLTGSIAVGCSKQVTYRAGVYTHSVHGQIQLEPGQGVEEAFVIVRRYDLTLIETASGYRHRLSAAVLHPNPDGTYAVPFHPETRRLDLTFIARDCLPVNFSFQRTLGIGAFEYDVQLVRDGQWKDVYFLLIKPVLVDLIVENRYRLAPVEQLFLGHWMDQTENRL
jgi:hypothetical protein